MISQVLQLFSWCPVKNVEGELKLDHRGQSAVIALGIYYLEYQLNFPGKPFPHKSKILPYFLDLLKKLPEAQWTDSSQLFQNRCLPTSECFVFCLTTFLCDVAVLDLDARKDILQFQIFYLHDLTQLVLKNNHHEVQTEDKISNGALAKRIIPGLIGHARAMGRFLEDSGPLFLKLFPKPSLPSTTKTCGLTKEKNCSFTNFRSIFPRTVNNGLTLSLSDSFQKPSNYDCATIYFRNFGSNFNVSSESIQFSVAQLEMVLKVAQALLLDKKVLKYFDLLAYEAFALQSIFPYKNFSETLNLVLVAVLKQILSSYSQLPPSFMANIQELVRSLFALGQTELQSRYMDHHKHQLLESKLSNTLTSATR